MESQSDGERYVYMPTCMRVILKDVLPNDTYEMVMRINDGSEYPHSHNNDNMYRNTCGYAPVIEYLEGKGL